MEEIKGTVGLTGEYFLKMAKYDYEDHNRALAREFIQNSEDAGSSRIDITIDGDSRTITVSDDGCGMDLDVVRNKLLVLGGSHKAKGTVGAFGKAKEVLFFSWRKYRIRTNGLEVEGSGGVYTINKADEHIEGTEATIWIQDGEDFGDLRDAFGWVAQRMQIAAKVYINGNLIFCEYRRGRAVREVEGVGILYQFKTKESSFMLIRIDGIWMHSRYIGPGYGALILELNRESVDVLTSNRDGLKSDARDLVSKFLQELAVNKASALKKQNKEIIALIEGTGKVFVQKEKLDEIGGLIGVDPSRQLIAATLKEVFAEVGTNKDVAETRAECLTDVIKKKGNLRWASDSEKIVRMAAYKPDFVVRFRKKQGRKVNNFLGTKRAGLLANLWTEMVKQVLLDCEYEVGFTAGFTFDPELEAQFFVKEGNTYFLINPWNVGPLTPRWEVGEEIKDRAIHEVTHLSSTYHDEDFVNRMARVRRKTRKSRKVYNKIKKM